MCKINPMKKTQTILLMFSMVAGFSQQPAILTISFKDVQNSNKLHIQAYLTGNDFLAGQKMIDSVDIKNTGNITFSLPAGTSPGLLTLYFYSGFNGNNSNANIDLLFDGSDINLQTCLSAFEDSLVDISRGVNAGFLLFKNQKAYFESYLQSLMATYNQTPENDKFRDVISGQIEKNVMEQKRFFDLTVNNPATDMASKMARWQLQSVLYNYEKPEKEKLKKTFLHRFDFSDPLLQRVKLLETIAQSYMFLYREEGMDAGTVQDQAIIAITRFMDALSVNADVSNGMASILARDFMQAGLDHIAMFVEETYLLAEAGCVNNRSQEEVIADIDALKKTQPGNPAPEIYIHGDGFSGLSGIDSEITVIIFWADWCSHCRQVLPQYYSLLEKTENVSVIAIALDEGENLKNKAIHDFPGWVHIQATGIWDDPVVTDYSVMTDEIFDDMAEVVIIKEVAGSRVYWPAMNINTLQNLVPGKAYFVLMNNSCALTFPPCDRKRQSGFKTHSVSFDLEAFNIQPTASSHTIAILPSALSGFEPGSIIGAFDQSGSCFGVAVCESETIGLSVFGDDPTTSINDGFEEGETMFFKVFTTTPTGFYPARAGVLQLTPIFDLGLTQADGTFTENGLSAITRFMSATGFFNGILNLSINIFPNPSHGQVNITGFFPETIIGVTDLQGQTIKSAKADSENILLDLTGCQPGVFFIKIEQNGNNIFRKMANYFALSKLISQAEETFTMYDLPGCRVVSVLIFKAGQKMAVPGTSLTMINFDKIGENNCEI